jgi:hypothetical protein
MNAIGYVTIGAFDGKQVCAGNGIMIGYQGKSPDEVGAAHAAGTKHGGTDQVASGFRPPEAQKGLYAAYMRDPTGHKPCIFRSV